MEDRQTRRTESLGATLPFCARMRGNPDRACVAGSALAAAGIRPTVPSLLSPRSSLDGRATPLHACITYSEACVGTDDVDSVIPHWFTVQMARMVDLRFPPSALHGLWEGLQGLPVAVLDAAVTCALQTREVFPTAAELREDADLARPQPAWTAPSGSPQCDQCRDTGFAPTSAPNTVRRCACWADNPVLVRQRESHARYAHGRPTRRP